MSDNLNAGIEEAKRMLAERDQLNQALPAQRELLKQEGFRRCRLETNLEWINEEIRKLESLSLDALVASLLGGKQRKLDAKREEAQAAQAEFEECLSSLASIEQEIRAIEQQLAALADVETDYRAMCNQKQNQILAGSDENATRLNELTATLDRLGRERRKITKVMQIGDHLGIRLQSMATAVRRTKKKNVGYAVGGALFQVAGEALARRGMKGSVDRVTDGFVEFRELLADMELDGESATDQELIHLIAEIDQFAVQMDHGAAFEADAPRAMQTSIKDLLGHLEDRDKSLEKQIADTEAVRLAILDSH